MGKLTSEELQDDLSAVQAVFAHLLDSCSFVNVYLYRINKSREGVVCTRFALSLKEDTFKSYIADLVSRYDNLADEYEGVTEYNGQYFEDRLRCVNIDSPYVKTVWDSIVKSRIFAEKEWVVKFGQNVKDPKGVMIETIVSGKSVTVIMDTPPIWRLSHMWSLSANRFKAVGGPLLVLPLKVDAVRIGKRIYFFTKKGCSIFRLQEEIDMMVENTIKEISAIGALAEEELFAGFAKKGHNPRRLMNFKEGGRSKLIQLADSKKGKKIRDAFGINYADGRIVTRTAEETERVIKMVTGRGMTDPFEGVPMEVSGASPWSKK